MILDIILCSLPDIKVSAYFESYLRHLSYSFSEDISSRYMDLDFWELNNPIV